LNKSGHVQAKAFCVELHSPCKGYMTPCVCLIKRDAEKTNGGVEVWAHTCLSSAQDAVNGQFQVPASSIAGTEPRVDRGQCAEGVPNRGT
jgi:hypothetical protein